MTSPLNALTIDVEDYFMASAFEAGVPKARWGQYESRVVMNTRRVLDILKEFGVRATFFTVGWVAENFPGLVREIASGGHEIACHGHFHRLVYDQSPDDFRQDLRMAKKALEGAVGKKISGYRAPSFSIVKETPWALGILKEEGFLYDASILPAGHARGGWPGSPRFPYVTPEGVVELPMSTFRLAGKNFPFSGGGYFRLFPYWLTRMGVDACRKAGYPCIVYLHPWELDGGQPRLKAKWKDNLKHHLNIGKTESKLRCLLRDFRFGTVQDVLDESPLLKSR